MQMQKNFINISPHLPKGYITRSLITLQLTELHKRSFIPHCHIPILLTLVSLYLHLIILRVFVVYTPPPGTILLYFFTILAAFY